MVVIEASVAVRWFVFGPGSEHATPWQERPDLIAIARRESASLVTADLGFAALAQRAGVGVERIG